VVLGPGAISPVGTSRGAQAQSRHKKFEFSTNFVPYAPPVVQSARSPRQSQACEGCQSLFHKLLNTSVEKRRSKRLHLGVKFGNEDFPSNIQ
jgi:hypothetical protein